MKTKYSLMLFILLFPVFVYAQQGNTMSSPLEVGAFGSDFEYSDTKNTENFTMDRFIMISSISLY